MQKIKEYFGLGNGLDADLIIIGFSSLLIAVLTVSLWSLSITTGL